MIIRIESSTVRWPSGRKPDLVKLTFDFGDEAVPDAFKAAIWPDLAALQVQPRVEHARFRQAYSSRYHQSPVATLTTLSADSLTREHADELADLGRALLADEALWPPALPSSPPRSPGQIAPQLLIRA